MTTGLSNINGRAINAQAHLYQSINDILTTPVGSRVMRRNYGSNIYLRQDQPTDQGLIADIIADTAEALALHEPRFKLTKVRVTQADENGTLSLDLVGRTLPEGDAVVLEGVQL